MPALPRRRYLALLGSTAVAGCGASESSCPVTTPPDPGTDWPLPRRDAGNTAAAPAAAMPDPTAMRERWTAEFQYRTTPPVVADGRVFLVRGRPTGEDPGWFDPVVVALDASDGSELWRHTVPNETDTRRPELPRPMVVDDTVYVSVSEWTREEGGRGTVRAIAADTGEAIWTAHRPVATLRGALGSLLLVSRDSGLEAIAAADGRRCWRWGAAGLFGSGAEFDLYGLPALADETVVGVLTSGVRRYVVAGIDAATGEERWRSRQFEAQFAPMHPVATERAVVVPTGGRLTAFEAADGALRWETDRFHGGDPLRDLTVGATTMATSRARLYGLARDDRTTTFQRPGNVDHLVLAGEYLLGTESRAVEDGEYAHDLLTLDAETGRPVARMSFDTGLSRGPVVAGGQVFLHNAYGRTEGSPAPTGTRVHAYG